MPNKHGVGVLIAEDMSTHGRSFCSRHQLSPQRLDVREKIGGGGGGRGRRRGRGKRER